MKYQTLFSGKIRIYLKMSSAEFFTQHNKCYTQRKRMSFPREITKDQIVFF